MGWLKDVTKFKDRHGNFGSELDNLPRQPKPPAQRRGLSPPLHENFQQHSQVLQSFIASSSHVQLEHLQHSLNPLQPIASNFITFALGSSYNYRIFYNG